MGPGISGLAFVGIGVGSTLGIVLEPLWRKIINSHPKDPETGRVQPEATASVMLIGAVLHTHRAAGVFLDVPPGHNTLGHCKRAPGLTPSWRKKRELTSEQPIAFGIPFGMGNTLSFIYGSNYLAGSYGIYAASALAGNAVTRSLFGGTLPLAGPAM